jgi:hypothetical protein
VVLAVAGQDAEDARPEAGFTAQEEAKWAEFVADSGKYEAGLDAELAEGTLTPAELGEQEQGLDRPRRWYRAREHGGPQ